MTEKKQMLETENDIAPVAFFVFNRPSLTSKVFQTIRNARPRTLLLVADGPRQAKQEEADRCNEVRQIIQQVDWPCEVYTDFSDENLGCKRRVSSGINWVFSLVDRAIFLEDDCLPDPSFFRFCTELLEYYKDDQRVMQICGSNFSPKPNNPYSYSFTKFGPIWGWATWKRAWDRYDVTMKDWPKVKNEQFYYNFWEVPWESEFRIPLYEDIYSGKVDTWDLQWSFAKFINSGLCIMPATNLIANIGFGADATHTSDSDNELAALEASPIQFPIKHYPFVTRDWETDRRIGEKTGPKNWLIQNYKQRLEAHPKEFLTAEGYSPDIPWKVKETLCCACGCSILKQSVEHPLYKVCMDCGSYVLAQFIAEEQLAVLYGKAYWYEHQRAIGLPTIEERYQSDMLDRIPHWVARVKSIKPPPATVLELGCAHGRLLQELSKIGYSVTGVEYSKDIADLASRLSKVRVLTEIPTDELFDVIVANDVLEHIYEPQEFTARITALLKPEGKLMTQVPTNINADVVSNSLRPYYHTYVFSANCLGLLAKRSTLKIDSISEGLFGTHDIVWSKADGFEERDTAFLKFVPKSSSVQASQRLKSYLRKLCLHLVQRYLS